MIALKDGLPLVEFDGGRVVAFERDWMVASLLQAANKAGYPQWWLAEHVTESIATYLRLRFDENVVALPRLAKAVQSVLQVIGYAEVASHYEPSPPPLKVSLFEIARAAGSGYELAFFELLGRTIQEMLTANSTRLELFALERCVKQLRAKKVWCRDCDALRAEIVAFVREQIDLNQTGQEIVFSLS
jgi:hypothetical protein